MANNINIPESARIALTDMVENCAQIRPGQEVLILAHRDDFFGGSAWVDQDAVDWTAAVVEEHGAKCSVLWIDEPQKLHEWYYPPVVKAALAAADVCLNFSYLITTEEFADFRAHIDEVDTWMVRMFPPTAALLRTDWAKTPHELVSMIRHVSSRPFNQHMAPFVMTDPNGTHLEGFTLNPVKREGIPGMAYDSWRRDASHYLPWPEWVHPPINCKDVNGVFFFHEMLSWWARYIELPPAWDTDIRIDVADSRIVEISGGPEAKKLKDFLKVMETKVGDGIWKFDTFHFGVHPNACVTAEECPNEYIRRTIDHSHSCNLHVHIGSAASSERYHNIYPHITGDIRHADLKVGDTMVYEQGYLNCLQDPEVLAVAAKYPGRPGIPPKP